MNKQKGQSTLEFILGLGLGMMMFVFLLRVSFHLAKVYVAQHASYMAARSYMVYDNNGSDTGSIKNRAKNWGQQVFQKHSVSILMDSEDELTFFSPGELAHPLLTGARYKFKLGLFVATMFGGQDKSEFEIDSFLGRSPSRRACYERVCYGLGQTANTGQACPSFSTPYDNGC